MKCISLYLLIFLPLNLCSQKDSIFVSYPSGTNSINDLISETSDGLAFLSYQFSNSTGYYSLIKVDERGVELNRIDSIGWNRNMNNFAPQSVNSVNNGFLIFGTVKREGKNNLLGSILVSQDFSDIQVVDSIVLEGNEILSAPKFKLNFENNLETFGFLQDSENIQNQRINYVLSNNSGSFISFKELKIRDKTYVSSFLRLEISKMIVVSTIAQKTFLLNGNLGMIDSMVNSFDSRINGQLFFDGYSFDRIVEHGGKLFCSGNGINENEYNLSLVEVSLDPLMIDSVYPAIPKSVPWEEVVQSEMEIDHEGNFLLVGTGFYSLLFSGDNPNSLFITKYSTDQKLLWSFRIRDTRSLVVRDMHIDQNNDIILVGEYRNQGFDSGERRNFLMKIYSDGTLSSSTGPVLENLEFKVFPNPTSGILYFEKPNAKNIIASIYSLDGILQKRFSGISNKSGLEVDSLKSGHYFLVLKNEKGELLKAAKFQKN